MLLTTRKQKRNLSSKQNRPRTSRTMHAIRLILGNVNFHGNSCSPSADINMHLRSRGSPNMPRNRGRDIPTSHLSHTMSPLPTSVRYSDEPEPFLKTIMCPLMSSTYPGSPVRVFAAIVLLRYDCADEGLILAFAHCHPEKYRCGPQIVTARLFRGLHMSRL